MSFLFDRSHCDSLIVNFFFSRSALITATVLMILPFSLISIL